MCETNKVSPQTKEVRASQASQTPVHTAQYGRGTGRSSPKPGQSRGEVGGGGLT